MSQNKWSLVGELCAAAHTSDATEALHSLGLITALDVPYQITETSWEPGGSETYLFRFAITTEGLERKLVVKACVALGAGGANATIEEWVARRVLLADHGVQTPRLIASGRGSVVEEWIDEDLWTAFRHADRQSRLEIVTSIAFTLAVISRLGFDPISLHDLRCKDQKVVMVDFGHDLGPPDEGEHEGMRLLTRFTKRAHYEGVAFSDDEMGLLMAHYESGMCSA